MAVDEGRHELNLRRDPARRAERDPKITMNLDPLGIEHRAHGSLVILLIACRPPAALQGVAKQAIDQAKQRAAHFPIAMIASASFRPDSARPVTLFTVSAAPSRRAWIVVPLGLPLFASTSAASMLVSISCRALGARPGRAARSAL